MDASRADRLRPHRPQAAEGPQLALLPPLQVERDGQGCHGNRQGHRRNPLPGTKEFRGVHRWKMRSE